MKNREFLNLIGSVNEDYIQAADSKVVRPRFRWKAFAACAACAAVMICAYPVYRMVNPPLHSYTMVERGGTMNTLDGESTVTGGQGVTDNLPGGAYVGNGSTPSGGNDWLEDPGSDLSGAPTDKAAATQYDRLLQGMGVRGNGEIIYPDWFAGAWFEDGILTVGIVDELPTPELEMEIKGWVQTDIAFQDAKYSYTYLDALMEKTVARIEGAGLTCGVGVDVTANRLGVDLYNEETAPEFKKVLAALAELDPAGDAIQVRVFAGQTNTLTDGAADDPIPAPVPGGITEPAPGTVENDRGQEAVQPASVEG
ncbi:hypothetical protein AALA82_00535 [Oscillospiraceae bacterium 50-16]